jgi:hypothetical protein
LREDGKKCTKQGDVKLTKDEVVAIVKVLLPTLDPGKKPKDYEKKGPCMQWLMNLPGEKKWDAEMEAWNGEILSKEKAEPHMFENGFMGK